MLKTHPDLYSALCQDMERDLSVLGSFAERTRSLEHAI